MKRLLLLLIPVFLVHCFGINENKQENGEFDYLIGSWKRTNSNPNTNTYEIWEKDASNTYQGLGFTLEKMDTIFKEEILIIKRGENWILAVSGVNEDVTPFSITSYGKDQFICNNDENEFPKRIKYSLVNDTLKAIISDDSREILFNFERN